MLVMKKVIVILVMLFLVACSTGTNSRSNNAPLGACTVESYRNDASVIVRELSAVSTSLDITDSASRSSARTELNQILFRVNRLRCRDEYPLKHETLEYTIRHTLDSLDYMDDGENVKALESMDRALVNVNRFNDWTVDID